jgi:hypothetical protein
LRGGVSTGEDMSKNDDIGLPGILIGSSLGLVPRRRDSLIYQSIECESLAAMISRVVGTFRVPESGMNGVGNLDIRFRTFSRRLSIRELSRRGEERGVTEGIVSGGERDVFPCARRVNL